MSFVSLKKPIVSFPLFNEQCEHIAQVAHKKRAMWTNCAGGSPKKSEWAKRSFFWVNPSFAHFFAKNEQLKTYEQSPNPGYFFKYILNIQYIYLCTFLFHSKLVLLSSCLQISRIERDRGGGNKLCFSKFSSPPPEVWWLVALYISTLSKAVGKRDVFQGWEFAHWFF